MIPLHELRKELGLFMEDLKMKDVMFKTRKEIIDTYIKKRKDDIKRRTKEDNIE